MGTAGMNAGLRAVFGRLRAYRVKDWGPDSADMAPDEDREIVSDLNEAHVVASILEPQPDYVHFEDLDFDALLRGEEPKRRQHEGTRHMLLLDLDVPAYLVESSTQGHSHLYVDVPYGIPEDVYWRLIDVLAEAGVIEPGYANVSKERGYTALRLPWIHKLMDEEKQAKSIEDLAEVHRTFDPSTEF